MVFRFNQTKFNKFSDKIYKISKEKIKEKKFENEILMATLIASFSSTHSWKTNKELDNGFTNMYCKDIEQEYTEAKIRKWKNISITDIKEIASKNIPDNVFYRWLNSYINNNEKKAYKKAWSSLKNRIFEENCD